MIRIVCVLNVSVMSCLATTHLGFNLDDNVKNLIAAERNIGTKFTVDKEVTTMSFLLVFT